MKLRHIVLLALIATSLAARCSRTPGDDSAEAGFARDMATHHEQAVEMSFILRDATADTRLRTLAYDIIVTQSAQRGMFMAWLESWGLPQASNGPRMAWMPAGTHASHDTAHREIDGAGMPLMMGMASQAELDLLRRATGTDAETQFLQLMIRHHEGGVLMARALLERSSLEPVATLARSIENGQSGEIRLMVEMLAERGGKPLPSLLPNP